MTDCLPYISKTKRKIISNQTVEEISLTVQGGLLSDCKEAFDERWEE
jgi:hypothetical protein